MKKILIGGGGLLPMEVMAKLNGMFANVTVVAEMPKQMQFEPEPIYITNDRLEFEPMKFYEVEPSKFISKPKNNFKKR